MIRTKPSNLYKIIFNIYSIFRKGETKYGNYIYNRKLSEVQNDKN